MRKLTFCLRTVISFTLLLALSGCFIPGTYYDPFDDYVRGIRFFDRGQFETARAIWEHLAKQNDCDAQFRLGTLYFVGAGVPRNYETARQWFVTAANQGQALAQAILATMYAHDVIEGGTHIKAVRFDCSHGCGLDKNMTEAYRWARLAERFAVYEASREGSRQLASQYSSYLTADQRAEAERQIQEWKPTPAQCNQRRLL